MNPNHRHADRLAGILKTLPSKPGVYQYFDESGTIIYVGKAKDLKKRVSSYFNKDQGLSGKVQVLVRRVADIRTIVVNTEMDALLLENNLIKEHQPRYNILLKDDKTYPWIVIRNEPFPRIHATRTVVKDGSQYFGPYASVKAMHTLLDLVRHLYSIRNCSLNLSQNNIQSGKYKVCLEYHIGNCKGPCEGRQSAEEYNTMVSQIRQIIRGQINPVKKELHDTMMEHAAAMEFEKAHAVKEKLEGLEKFQARSTVVSPTVTNVDVVTIVTDDLAGYVNYLKVENGAVIQAFTLELRKRLDESPEEMLMLGLTEMRQMFQSTSPEIIVPFAPDTDWPGVTFTVPQRGDKKSLLDLSERNARQFRFEMEKQRELVDPDRHSKRIMTQMQTDLRMPVKPEHIECFDNSNIQGAYPVAAMVVFKNGRPEKKEYRHFNIKTVEGPNDFASMEEIIHRRYSRLLEEEKPLPQLIVVDGGKGQLSAAVGSLEKLGLRGSITILGIAKRLEELYFPDDPVPLYLDKKSETLRVIQQMRDEAHRFGITHHRKRREKGTVKTSLTDIAGIGETTANKLLKHFKSVKRIQEATPAELEQVVGKSKAAVIIAWRNP